jgi:hypothetical protein
VSTTASTPSRFAQQPLRAPRHADIEAAIAELEGQAQAVLDQERAGLISRIKEAIKAYGLTAHDPRIGRSYEGL